MSSLSDGVQSSHNAVRSELKKKARAMDDLSACVLNHGPQAENMLQVFCITAISINAAHFKPTISPLLHTSAKEYDHVFNSLELKFVLHTYEQEGVWVCLHL